MAGAAIHGRLTWYASTLVERRDESSTARTLVLRVPDWPGHDAGQHVDVRLTAPDGYSTVRSYSIANAPDGERLELTVERVDDGEVSPYLLDGLSPGNSLEILGPIGGWFVWHPAQTDPVQLLAGGSGIVPLMAMIRTRAQSGNRSPFRLLYSVRDPGSAYYAHELKRRSAEDGDFNVTYAYTRVTPPGWTRPAKRVDSALIAETAFSAEVKPACYVCGPTAFVETVSALLTAAGHEPSRIRTERFGPTGS